MRRLHLVLWACLASFQFFGQDINTSYSSTENIGEQIEYVLSDLDMSYVTSGILQDRSIPMGYPELYGPSTASDDVYCNMTLLGIQYEGMYAASLPYSNSLEPSSSAFQSELDQYEAGEMIPLKIMTIEYQKFKDKAVDDGLLVISGGKLHYGTSNPSDAYEDKKLFHSGFFTNSWGMNSEIRLNPNDIIGNFSIDQNSVYIDFDNGQGYQHVTLGSPTSVSYTSEGDYVIKLKFKDVDGEDVVHYHKISVENNALSVKETKGQSTDRGLPLGITCSSNADYCRTITVDGETVMYSVKLACPGSSSDLKKPFIILDGIDLLWDQNTFSFDQLLSSGSQGLNFSNSQVLGGTNLGEILELGGYDVIFVDYFDHHIRIQDNAAVVEEVIRDVNTQLALNDSSEPIKMMGISMGGLVGKYALLEMEDNGEQHNVDKYFTFDSPMQGANVPVSLQAPIPHILKVPVPTILPNSTGSPTILPLRFMKFAEPLVFFENVLKSPAARQLTQINIYNGGGVPGYNWDGIDMNQEFFDELDGMGELEQADIYAISNGSDRGAAGRVLRIDGTFLLPSQVIYSFDDDLVTTINGVTPASVIQNLEVAFEISKGNSISAPLLFLPALPTIISNVVDIDLVGRAVGGAAGTPIYEGQIKMSLFFGLIQFGPELYVKNMPQTPSLDGCPGGTLGNSLVPFLGPLFTVLPTGLSISATDLCFIPTVSALDIQGPDNDGDNMLDNLLIDLSDGNSVNTINERIVAEDEPIPGLAPAPAMVNNNSHVTLTRDNVLLLVDELLGNLDLSLEALPHILSSKFNYGDSGAGTQVIGGVQVFGKTSTILPNDYTIVDGGAIFINDENRINYMDDPINPYNMNNSFYSVEVVNQGCAENTGVVFEYRGLLEIGDYSASNEGELIINDGTSVTFEKESNTIINTNSKIIVKDGGLLWMKEGANVRLLGNSQIIVEPGGKLIYEQNTNLILEDYGELVDEKSGSKIIIEGELEVIGTELNAEGNGSFVFHHIESINVPSKELTITRNGDRVNEVLQVKGGVEFYDVKVQIEECKIMNAGYIELHNTAEFIIKNADVEGGVVTTYSVDKIDMEHSEFYNEVLFEFYDADFFKSLDNDYYNRAEVFAFNCLRGSFTSDDFEMNSKVKLHDIDSHVIFKDCKMNAYNFGISDVDADYLDRKETAIALWSSNADNPFSLILDNTEVKYYEYGIAAGEIDYPVNGQNIFLRNQSTLFDNYYGIYMRGDETSGMVEMVCSNLIDNQVGIKGIDILLNIDAVLHAMSGDGIIRPNKFINDENSPASSKRFFDICYQKKNIQNAIPANGNYWRIGYFFQNTPSNYSDYLIRKSMSQNSCVGNQELSLIVDELLSDEPFGCPPPGPITPNCPHSVDDIGMVNFTDIMDNSPDSKILNNFIHEYCFDDDICTSDYSIHGHYWAGHQCIDLNSFESAAEFLDPIAWSQFENIGMSVYCKQQSLFAAHILNGYNNDPQQSQQTFTITEECEGDTTDFFFLLDASSSVSTSEYDLMVESVINTLKDINIGVNRFAVANFAASNTFDLIVPFTNQLADTMNITRTLNGGTNVYNAFVYTKDYILDESSKNAQKIILYTDAYSGQFHTPPFDVYNEVKSAPINAEVFVIRYQNGLPAYDNYANEISAAIASKGGTWTGPVASNPGDPEGSGGPRKLLAEAFSGSVPLLTEGLVSCDTLTVTIPDDCIDPVIVWSSADGGQILGDSIDVLTIVTNGVGSYTVSVTCKDGCEYVLDNGSSSDGERVAINTVDYTRYRNGVKVNPHDFETVLSNERIVETSEYGIYPNPVRETLFLTNLSDEMLIELYDVSGRKISSFKNFGDEMSIDVGPIVKGIYFLRFHDLKSGNRESHKIVVTK